MLDTIYIVRHGWRCSFDVDPASGRYTNAAKAPTGIEGDVPLAEKGCRQAEELVAGLEALRPPVERIVSSPFWRCLETISPYARKHSTKVQVDPGVGEWYGRARFTHPVPADAKALKRFFPFVDEICEPSIVPSTSGESIGELYARVAYALTRLIAREDEEDGAHGEEGDVSRGCGEEERSRDGGGEEGLGGSRSLLICSHAAAMIAMGRVLTGRVPEDPAVDDFKTYTAGISTFKRRKLERVHVEDWRDGEPIPRIDYAKGIAGGWSLAFNSDCSHLSEGPARGWSFSGEEDFIGESEEGYANLAGRKGTTRDSPKL